MNLAVGIQGHAALGDGAQHLGVNDVLGLVDARLQSVDIVTFQHRHRALSHDGPLVVVLVGQMHRHARHLE